MARGQGDQRSLPARSLQMSRRAPIPETPPIFAFTRFPIPSPFDPRLILAHCAGSRPRPPCDTGVATRPITDFAAYIDQLSQFVFKSGLIMRPVFEQARSTPKRVIFSRRRGRPRAARGPDHPRRGHRPAGPDRPARGDPAAPERLGLRFRPGIDGSLVDPRAIRATTLLGRLSRADGAQGGLQPDRPEDGALQPDRDRRACRQPGDAGAMISRRRRRLPHPLQ